MLKLKINFKLLITILTLEILYIFVMFFILLFSLFLYFGSGAGADSDVAITSGKIAEFIIISPPILYNAYKIYKLKIERKSKELNSFIIAMFIYILLITYYIVSENFRT